MKIYFNVGIPKGRDLLAASLKLDAKLISFSVQSGSPGGSLIIANVQGIGKATVVKNFVYGTNNANNMCESVVIKSYGKVECSTKIKVIPDGT